MTKLDKPLVRLVECYGQEIIVELIPTDAGIPAHIKLRVKGAKKSYKSTYIEPPSTGPERQLGAGGGR